MIGILNYDSGHINNLASAVKHSGGDVVLMSSSVDEEIDKLIIYGDIKPSELLEFIKENDFDEFLRELDNSNVPILAINTGLHVLFDFIEHENIEGLGILKGSVKCLKETELNIDYYSGWLSYKLSNRSTTVNKDVVLFKSIDASREAMFYFNQTEYFVPESPEIITAFAQYRNNENVELSLPIAIKHNNFYGVQFLPEKSDKAGLRMLRNFVNC